MTKRKKQFYGSSRPSKKGPPPAGSEELPVRPNLAQINLEATTGRAGIEVGDRVRIEGSGRHSGELATVERVNSGVIPSALVRVDGGSVRQVRTIDLVPAKADKEPRQASQSSES